MNRIAFLEHRHLSFEISPLNSWEIHKEDRIIVEVVIQDDQGKRLRYLFPLSNLLALWKVQHFLAVYFELQSQYTFNWPLFVLFKINEPLANSLYNFLSVLANVTVSLSLFVEKFLNFSELHICNPLSSLNAKFVWRFLVADEVSDVFSDNFLWEIKPWSNFMVSKALKTKLNNLRDGNDWFLIANFDFLWRI